MAILCRYYSLYTMPNTHHCTVPSVAGAGQSHELSSSVVRRFCSRAAGGCAGAQVVFRIGLSKKGHPQVIKVKSIVLASVQEIG